MVSQKEGLVFGYSEDIETKKSIEKEGLIFQPYTDVEKMAAFAAKKLEKSGYTLSKSYPLPDYQNLLQKQSNKIEVPGGTVKISVRAIELVGANQETVLMVIAQSKTVIDALEIWTLDASRLVAPNKHFSDAKAIYLHALHNAELNPKVIDQANQEIKNEMQSN